jgi:hypothetical protein
MAETPATDVRFPAGRYGRRRERSSRPTGWLVAVGATVAVVSGVVIAVMMYNQYGRQEYTGNVLAFDTASRSVEVTFEVYKPAGEDATCLVRARSVDGAEVGHVEVPVTGEETHTTLTVTVPTSARPVTGELLRCYPPRLAPPHVGATLVVRFATGHRGA